MASQPSVALAGEACEKTPPAIRSLKLQRYYADAAGTVVDPDLKAKHRAQVAPLNDFLRHVVSYADKSIRRSKPDQAAEAGQCALQWLTDWARQGAWLGSMGTKQGEYQRKWDFTGVSLAYVKLQRFATTEQRAIIEPWLIKFADTARAFFNDRARRRNNHWYWLGPGLAATAIATRSRRHWDMARGIMKDAAADIAPDGSLAFEMERKTLAAKYHAFAAMPLVVLAEIGRSRGEDWYALGNGALHRLVSLATRGLQQPKLFMDMTGHEQQQPISPGAGWLPLYVAGFKDRLGGPLPQMKLGHRWLGGDVFLLSRALGQRLPR